MMNFLSGTERMDILVCAAEGAKELPVRSGLEPKKGAGAQLTGSQEQRQVVYNILELISRITHKITHSPQHVLTTRRRP